VLSLAAVTTFVVVIVGTGIALAHAMAMEGVLLLFLGPSHANTLPRDGLVQGATIEVVAPGSRLFTAMLLLVVVALHLAIGASLHLLVLLHQNIHTSLRLILGLRFRFHNKRLKAELGSRQSPLLRKLRDGPTCFKLQRCLREAQAD